VAAAVQTHVDPGNWIECHMMSGKTLKYKTKPVKK
jgi:hypothetical protein